MTRPIPFFGGPVSINRENLLHELAPGATSHGTVKPDYNSRFVLHGRFKGTRDNRGLRCFNKECRFEGYACCSHCTTLPYETLKLCNNSYTRNLLRLHLAFDLWRTRRGILDTKLKLLIEELQEFAETENILRKLNVKNSHILRVIQMYDEHNSPAKACKHVLAKGCFVKMRAKFWSAQAIEGRDANIVPK